MGRCHHIFQRQQGIVTGYRLTSYLLWDDSRYLSPAAVCFRDFLLEQAKAFSRT